jgi:hypothetical protein
LSSLKVSEMLHDYIIQTRRFAPRTTITTTVF